MSTYLLKVGTKPLGNYLLGRPILCVLQIASSQLDVSRTTITVQVARYTQSTICTVPTSYKDKIQVCCVLPRLLDTYVCTTQVGSLETLLRIDGIEFQSKEESPGPS